MSNGIAAVVVAAGRGVRAGGVMPKQYRPVCGAPVIRHALSIFIDHPQVEHVQPVIHRDDAATFAEATTGLQLRAPAFGRATRQMSVHSGLEALQKEQPRIVLVHDAARPFASAALISRAITAGACGAAIPGLEPTDTIKQVDADGYVVDTLDRCRLRAVQTPQAFLYDGLLAAHRRALIAGRD